VDPKDILIIGAGIAGCAAALALAQKGINVTVVFSHFDQRIYHASFANDPQLPSTLTFQEKNMCPRAWEQLHHSYQKSIEELLGHSISSFDIHKALQDRLQQYSNVEWLSHHTAVDLLTLESHSLKRADDYKRPACLGAYVYNHETQQVETILAKETLLATGGASSLFLHSTHLSTNIGEGWAMAHRAGARLLHLDRIQFHPLALFEPEKPCFPLPLDLLFVGGKILGPIKNVIEPISLGNDLSWLLYQEMLHHRVEHLWLDLTPLDPIELKERFPVVDAYCLSRGYNIAKDLLPIVPAAHHNCGGVAVDRLSQSSLYRLRAIGEVACTGLFYDERDEEVSIIESLTWASICAEDVAKQLEKFVYYFPPIKSWNRSIEGELDGGYEDWKMMRQVMWAHAGLKYDSAHLQKGWRLLNELHRGEAKQPFSIEKERLRNALQASLLIVQRLIDLAG
jgi:L-aspartate oxidase